MLGIIAGSGNLPQEIVAECQRQGRPFLVIAFEKITDKATINDIPHVNVNLGQVGKVIKLLKDNTITEVVMAGRVGRPKFSELDLDFSGLRLLKRLSKLPSQGDDKAFTAIIEFLERRKFKVIGVDDVLKELLMPKGTLGHIQPDKTAQKDIQIGMDAALEIGKLDIGQAVIIQQGMILGVEGAEGTDKLVKRCKELHTDGLGGVLVKMKKPDQDHRVDLPSMGLDTLENIHASGLRGVAMSAGGALVINREQVIERADELGLFVVGI